jgi:DNA (cytosine-5)-methyltransferase 1
VPPIERFERTDRGIDRIVRTRSGREIRTLFVDLESGSGPISANEAERLWLTSAKPSKATSLRGELRVVDLFSGCGGLTLGAQEAAHALGKRFLPTLAIDFEKAAAAVYAKNFPKAEVRVDDVANTFDSPVGSKLSRSERLTAELVGETNVLVGGPPCQGHSDLNNRTRRMDPKNELYFSMVRAAEVLKPNHVLIENVPGAANDKSKVVQRSANMLQELGYNVDFGVVDASRLGVPQKRKRLLLLASLTAQPLITKIEENYLRDRRTLRWAIEDLHNQTSDNILDESAKSAEDTRERINYLFDNDLYDLPDEMRPPCHRTKAHTYRSIYGRLNWDEPTQTITTGFFSMCMGRYVHPVSRRTLTAREASRIQYFPQSFDFSGVTKRSDLARMIGNAVPSRLALAAILELLR